MLTAGMHLRSRALEGPTVCLYTCVWHFKFRHIRESHIQRERTQKPWPKGRCVTLHKVRTHSQKTCVLLLFFTWSEWYCVWETTIEQCSTQAAGSGREEEGSVVWGGIFSLFSIFRYFSDSTYFITLNLIIENNLVILHLELCIFIGCICHMSSLKKVLINRRNMPSNTFQQI